MFGPSRSVSRKMIDNTVARNALILIFGATMTVLLGDGYYASFRSGVLKTIGSRRAVRRDQEPIGYWVGMAIGIFAFLAVASMTALLAFLVFMQLYQR